MGTTRACGAFGSATIPTSSTRRSCARSPTTSTSTPASRSSRPAGPLPSSASSTTSSSGRGPSTANGGQTRAAGRTGSGSGRDSAPTAASRGLWTAAGAFAFAFTYRPPRRRATARRTPAARPRARTPATARRSGTPLRCITSKGRAATRDRHRPLVLPRHRAWWKSPCLPQPTTAATRTTSRSRSSPPLLRGTGNARHRGGATGTMSEQIDSETLVQWGNARDVCHHWKTISCGFRNTQHLPFLVSNYTQSVRISKPVGRHIF
mmetsp:Transcript_30578/g.74489  ORF Transcript_30578/g.74489 Transcript_30578/m.74489 type:complete len:264 (+) Transcript_30578:1131-1922(+)